MKHLSAVLLLAALLLCACTPDTPPVESSDTTAPVQSDGGETTAEAVVQNFEGYALTVGQVRLLPGVTVGVDTLLGKPLDQLEAPSCVHEGNDIVYYYAGFEVVTSPSAAGNYVTSITITEESVKTEEGIGIGSPLKDAGAAYGAYDSAGSVPEFGRYVFRRGGTSITLLTDGDDVVTSISYAVEG